MVRSVLFFVGLAILIAVATWLADNPGYVTIDWRGYHLETSLGMLVFAVTALMVIAALTYRFWRYLRSVPSRIARVLREGRRRRGYGALTKGMVAVAAGDVGEARRQAKRADGMLEEPPLTMLLAAQAAQLDGDESAAKTYFSSMLKRKDTEFLGLRGLLVQARHDGDRDTALELAQRANRLRPGTPWVLNTLFDLQVQAGQWKEAHDTLYDAIRRKAIPADEGRRKRAIVLYQRALQAEEQGRPQALELLREAHDFEPGHIPMTVRLAARLSGDGKDRKARTLIEEAWAKEPHPDLARAYAAILRHNDPLEKVKDFERLAAIRPSHAESRLAVAEAALEARLWGTARGHLEALTDNSPSARVCRLMAELEQSEHGDATAAGRWLARAAEAEPDPAWICDKCGAAAAEWSADCGKCGAFDSLVWQSPPRLVPVSLHPAAAVPAVVEADAVTVEVTEPDTGAGGVDAGRRDQ